MITENNQPVKPTDGPIVPDPILAVGTLAAVRVSRGAVWTLKHRRTTWASIDWRAE